MPVSQTADPILASVLQRRVVAVSHEMATVLMRSSRSPIFNEIGDLVTVVFDRSGRTLAQTEFASIIAFGAGPSLQAIIETFGDDVHDGDVFLHNDVFTGGNQFADVGVYIPVFFEGELVAWTASKGHIADIGGMTLGGYDPAFREVWQEAFRIAPRRLHHRFVVALGRSSFSGACTAGLDLTWEDTSRPGLRPHHIGRLRLPCAPGRYGTETIDRHMDLVIQAAERRVRAEIEALARRDLPRRELHAVRRDRPDAAPARRGRGDDGLGHHVRLLRDRRPGRGVHEHARGVGDGRGVDRLPHAASASGLSIPTNAGLFASVHTVFREGSLIHPRFPPRPCSATRCETRSWSRS